MIDNGFAIADLQSRWYNLNDLDRAQAVKAIHQAGVSLRNLASLLNCSPSLLTHLLQAGQASLENRVLARRGELSTRTLVRRAKVTGTRPIAMHREAIAFEKALKTNQHGRAIIRWLDEMGVVDADRGEVVEKARLLSIAGGDSHLPLVAIPAYIPADKSVAESVAKDVAETVHKYKSDHPELPAIGQSDWFARQLALWAFSGISDIRVRQRAFELAHKTLTSCQGLAL